MKLSFLGSSLGFMLCLHTSFAALLEIPRRPSMKSIVRQAPSTSTSTNQCGGTVSKVCSTQHTPTSRMAFSNPSSRHSSNDTPFSRAWKWYLAALAASPLCTKAVTTGIVEVMGDSIAQYTESRKSAAKIPWNIRRSTGHFFDGLLVSGPLLHYSYGLLEDLIPSKNGAVWCAVLQVIIDEFVCDPIDVALYLTSTSLVEGKPVVARVRSMYWPTLREGLSVSLSLCPIQFLSFRYAPVQLRVLIVNMCDLIWMSAVSLRSHGAKPATRVLAAL